MCTPSRTKRHRSRKVTFHFMDTKGKTIKCIYCYKRGNDLNISNAIEMKEKCKINIVFLKEIDK